MTILSRIVKAMGKGKTKKGIVDYAQESGVHGHGLERESAKTKQDGMHSHWFELPQGGVAATIEDGEHSHPLSSPTADLTGSSGLHRHKVLMPDGTTLYTELDGEHSHQLMMGSSCLDGIHIHQLKLPDGKTARTYWPGEKWVSSGKPLQKDNLSAAPAGVLFSNLGGFYEQSIEVPESGAGMGVQGDGVVEGSHPTGEANSKPKEEVSYSVTPDVAIALAAMGMICEPIEKQRVFSVFKEDEEKRIVYGVVLEPDTEDTQGDVISIDEIEKAAHFYMINSRVVGARHKREMEAKVIESYLAPDDLEINGEKIKKGSWVLGVHIIDPIEWVTVKSDGYTGFSVGGWALREEAT